MSGATKSTLKEMTVSKATKELKNFEGFNIEISLSGNKKIKIVINSEKRSKSNLTVRKWIEKTFWDVGVRSAVKVLYKDESPASGEKTLKDVRESSISDYEKLREDKDSAIESAKSSEKEIRAMEIEHIKNIREIGEKYIDDVNDAKINGGLDAVLQVFDEALKRQKNLHSNVVEMCKRELDKLEGIEKLNWEHNVDFAAAILASWSRVEKEKESLVASRKTEV